MPRTLHPTLLNAMNSGSYTPIIRAWGVLEGTRQVELPVLGFRLHLDELELDCTGYSQAYPDLCLERGVSLGAVEYTIFSSIYDVERYEYRLGVFHLRCRGLYPGVASFSVGANKTYAQVIAAACEPWRTPEYLGDPAWKSYQVLPTDRSILMQSVRSVLPWLRQKYLLYCTDSEPGLLLWFSVADAYAQEAAWALTTTELDTLSPLSVYRRFLWRNEYGSTHTSGGSGYPIHNLGYLPASASPPAFSAPSDPHNYLVGTKLTVPANLKYRTGDAATINATKVVLDVTEVFDRTKSPAWSMELASLQFFHNTEGGSLPGTIEAAAPYTPLNTSNFAGVLASRDNNLQAAMETLDDHSHLRILSAAPGEAIAGVHLVFDTSSASLYIWDGAAWQPAGAGTAAGSLLLESGAFLLLEDASRITLD